VIKRDEKGRLRTTALKVKLPLLLKEEDVPRSKRFLEVFEDYCVVIWSVRQGIDVAVGVEPIESGKDVTTAVPNLSL